MNSVCSKSPRLERGGGSKQTVCFVRSAHMQIRELASQHHHIQQSSRTCIALCGIGISSWFISSHLIPSRFYVSISIPISSSHLSRQAANMEEDKSVRRVACAETQWTRFNTSLLIPSRCFSPAWSTQKPYPKGSIRAKRAKHSMDPKVEWVWYISASCLYSSIPSRGKIQFILSTKRILILTLTTPLISMVIIIIVIF